MVKAGDVVKVKVLEVDAARKRIALTMRLSDDPASGTGKRPSEHRDARSANRSNMKNGKPQRERAPQNSAMADAFAKLKK